MTEKEVSVNIDYLLDETARDDEPTNDDFTW